MEPKEKKAFEPTGLVPRSIVRTFERFRQQLLPGSEKAAIREYRISRYQVLVSARCLFALLTIPIATNWFVSSWLLSPLIEHLWNTQQTEIFLNSYQEERAFTELEFFSDKLFFESLLVNQQPAKVENFYAPGATSDMRIKYVPDNCFILTNLYAHSSDSTDKSFSTCASAFFAPLLVQPLQPLQPSVAQIVQVTPLANNLRVDAKSINFFHDLHSLEFSKNNPAISLNNVNISNSFLSPQRKPSKQLLDTWTINTKNDSLKIKEKTQEKILELAVYYNQQTILSITNVAGDMISIFTLSCLFIWMKPEISILKSFLIEAIYSLSDTTKSFLLILLTDLLVGFHSPRGWETALEILLKHFGLPENQDFVFLFVATFPVLLDTVFKYWIFRHLNKISPSTVATYHSMIE